MVQTHRNVISRSQSTTTPRLSHARNRAAAAATCADWAPAGCPGVSAARSRRSRAPQLNGGTGQDDDPTPRSSMPSNARTSRPPKPSSRRPPAPDLADCGRLAPASCETVAETASGIANPCGSGSAFRLRPPGPRRPSQGGAPDRWQQTHPDPAPARPGHDATRTGGTHREEPRSRRGEASGRGPDAARRGRTAAPRSWISNGCGTAWGLPGAIGRRHGRLKSATRRGASTGGR